MVVGRLHVARVLNFQTSGTEDYRPAALTLDLLSPRIKLQLPLSLKIRTRRLNIGINSSPNFKGEGVGG